MCPATLAPTSWLSKLKLTQLRRVAFLIGAPSSGTKTVLTSQIQQELVDFVPTDRRSQLAKIKPISLVKKLSVISIDMGIRNLAYAHLTADLLTAPRRGTDGSGLSAYSQPHLGDWKRVVVSGAPEGTASRKRKPKITDDLSTLTGQEIGDFAKNESIPKPGKEAFDPSTFAAYAYNFVKGILDKHQPTHVLIERQRFRSGGGSAVQEWTIRVGVFEGMLHAVLETLVNEQGIDVKVQAVDPGRVTRYWLQGRTSDINARVGSGKESKKAKIDIVGRWLEDPSTSSVDIPSRRSDHDVNNIVEAFLVRGKKVQAKRNGKASAEIGAAKLDDLSDCLLQGIAWLNWQHKRQDVLQWGANAFAGDSTFEEAPHREKAGLAKVEGGASGIRGSTTRKATKSSKARKTKVTR